MYICKECGNKYKEKVEYCECGNNTFEYIETTAKKEKVQKKYMTIEQKSEIISIIFFVVCIIFSIIVWIIPIKDDNTTTKAASPKKEIKLIPSIDKIWDDTPQKPAEDNIIIINETPIELTTLPDYTKPKQISQPKPEQPKKKQDTKIIKQEKPQTNIQKPKTIEQPQKQNPKSEVNKPKTEVKKEQPKNTNVQPKKTYNPNSPAMLRYKGALRAAMFSKFAVGSISGSGNCSVQFSVDSTGKLINRSFAKQSDNKSLNDAVYYMMMSVPRFNPPPSEYNGEIIKMDFKINNGEYEISIY